MEQREKQEEKRGNLKNKKIIMKRIMLETLSFLLIFVTNVFGEDASIISINENKLLILDENNEKIKSKSADEIVNELQIKSKKADEIVNELQIKSKKADEIVNELQIMSRKIDKIVNGLQMIFEIKDEMLVHNYDAIMNEEQYQIADEVTSGAYVIVNAKVTAYCPCSKCCGKKKDLSQIGITASGKKAVQGRTIAVDKNKIPLGTKVIIDGYEYIAEDTGSAIKDNRIDLFMNSHSRALEWGVQEKQIYILK